MSETHDDLSFIIACYKDDPREAEEKGETIQGQERGESRFLRLLAGSIEPEDLGESNEGNYNLCEIK
jgi:hypothetical protein